MPSLISFLNTLNNNKNNPKKFWRISKNFTDDNLNVNVIPEFKDPLTNVVVPQHGLADYLNCYFVDI